MQAFSLFGEIALKEADKVQAGLRAVDQAGQTAGKKMGEFGNKMQTAGQTAMNVGGRMTAFVTAPILAFGAAAIMVGANFDESMSRVQAVTGATGGEINKLRDFAKQMGSTTQFSATQAADAMGFLGMAGFSTTQIMQSLPDVLNLASAGAMDLGNAADITSNIMSAFGMNAGETARMTDVLAKAATSSNTSVEQMGEAMKYVAPVAASQCCQDKNKNVEITNIISYSVNKNTETRAQNDINGKIHNR